MQCRAAGDEACISTAGALHLFSTLQVIGSLHVSLGQLLGCLLPDLQRDPLFRPVQLVPSLEGLHRMFLYARAAVHRLLLPY